MIPQQQLKIATEAAAVGSTGVATFLGVLPVILGCLASAMGIAYLGLQMYFMIKDRKANNKDGL